MRFLPFALLSLLAAVLLSCGGNTPAETSENYLDAARNFIRSALDGKFREARRFMLEDSLNNNYMDIAERSYNRSDGATRDGYRGASINIHLSRELNDSTAIVIYSNSFKNDHDTLRVVRTKGQWLVDLKYLFQHDMDTLKPATPLKDTLR